MRFGRTLSTLALASLLGACAARPQLVRATLEGRCWVDDSIAIEKEWDAKRSTVSPPPGENWFIVEEGHIPVLLTAPHATEVLKNGVPRHSDGGGTAALALALHRILGAHAIYTVYRAPSDPNSAAENEFRTAVSTLVASGKIDLVLDIHGSDYLRPYDVDFGTRDLKSLRDETEILDELSSALGREGLINQSLDYFAAKGNTITGLASSAGVAAIQLEINASWLTPSEGRDATHRFAEMLQALVRYLAARYRIQTLAQCPSRP